MKAEGADRTRYESHAWNPGEGDDECVACGVTWQDCESECPGTPQEAGTDRGDRMTRRTHLTKHRARKAAIALAVLCMALIATALLTGSGPWGQFAWAAGVLAVVCEISIDAGWETR